MKAMNSVLRAVPLTLAVALASAGCATHHSTGTNVGRSEARQVQTVQQGVVQSVRVVTIQPDGRNVGGAIAGAAVGNAVGGPVATVGGAAAGSAIQGSAGTQQGLEVTVLLDNGKTVAVVQAGPLDAFRPADKVNVTTSGNTTRVSRR